MIFGQLATAAMLFAKFHAGTRKLLSDFWPPLLEEPIKLCPNKLHFFEGFNLLGFITNGFKLYYDG